MEFFSLERQGQIFPPHLQADSSLPLPERARGGGREERNLQPTDVRYIERLLIGHRHTWEDTVGVEPRDKARKRELGGRDLIRSCAHFLDNCGLP
jgi:hypothetical protein